MSKLSQLPPEQRAYRRLSPPQWDAETGVIAPRAFALRPGEEGLSLFRADIRTPRGVLQECIDGQKRRLRSRSPEVRRRARLFLEKNGDTPESLVRNGWRVAEIALREFDREGLRVEQPELNGHFQVKGAVTIFAELILDLSEEAILLDVSDCLHG